MRTLLEIGLSNALMVIPLALLAALLARVCRRPALSHCLWLLVFLKLLTPPFVRVPLPLPAYADLSSQPTDGTAPNDGAEGFQPAEVTETDLEKAIAALESYLPSAEHAGVWQLVPLEPIAEMDGAETNDTHLQDWTQIAASVPSAWLEGAAGLWLASAFLWFGWTARSTWRFQRLLRFAKPGPRCMQDDLRSLAARLGLTQYPSIWLVPGAVSPMLWAIGRAPRLLFPARLLEQLDKEQRATLLAHELAHYRRRDHWVRLVEMTVFGFFWWHPIVWWAQRELREAEEQCCDAWVVWALADAGRAYATALLQTVAFFSQARCTLPAAASGIGQVRQLRRRLTMIMQKRTPRSLSWTGCLAVLTLGLLALPLLPVRAQQAANPKEQYFAFQESSTDQKIAELKKQLQKLEEQKRSQREVKVFVGKANEEEENSAKKAAIEKNRAEAEVLAKKVVDMRHSLQAAEAQLQKARAALAKLEGKPFSETFYEVHGDGKVYWFQHTPDAKGPGKVIDWVAPPVHTAVPLGSKENQGYIIRDVPVDAGQHKEVQEFQYRVIPDVAGQAQDKKVIVLDSKASPKGVHVSRDRSADLEKRLEMMAKQIEELRRELKQSRGPGGERAK